MKLLKSLMAALAVATALAAHADTRVIEGHGIAKNRDGIAAAFNLRVGQVNNDPAQGRFEMSWTRGDVKIKITTEHPRFVGIRDREGRFEGPAIVTVTKGADVRRWEGTVYFTALDLRDANHQQLKDKVRVRFIRNVWENPEGDFFFEGEVTEGDVSVKKT